MAVIYRVITPCAPLRAILRVPVFRIALDDRFSKMVRAVFVFFSKIFSNRFRGFDPARAEAGLQRFKKLGAEVSFISPSGVGQVQMMAFQATDLEKKVEAAGGIWEKQNNRFIIRPNVSSPSFERLTWQRFKEDLSHFRWDTETIDGEEAFITCDCADAIPSASSKWFLFAHSTTSVFASYWRRAGYYLGAKQNFCSFDNGNSWKNSGRPVSELSFYEEAEAAYQELQRLHRPHPTDVFAGGSCGGAPVGAYLKKMHHDEGINSFTEQSFADLTGFGELCGKFSFLASRVKGSLNEAESSEAAHFGIETLWKDLKTEKGKYIQVDVHNDNNVPKASSDHLYRVGQRVSKSAARITFHSSDSVPHDDDFYKHPQARREFFSAVFNYTEIV